LGRGAGRSNGSHVRTGRRANPQRPRGARAPGPLRHGGELRCRRRHPCPPGLALRPPRAPGHRTPGAAPRARPAGRAGPARRCLSAPGRAGRRGPRPAGGARRCLSTRCPSSGRRWWPQRPLRRWVTATTPALQRGAVELGHRVRTTPYMPALAHRAVSRSQAPLACLQGWAHFAIPGVHSGSHRQRDAFRASARAVRGCQPRNLGRAGLHAGLAPRAARAAAGRLNPAVARHRVQR